jgi:hypothetical protein
MDEANRSEAELKSEAKIGRFNNWLTIAANLGVLAGLILVILQLNQNEKMMRAQTRHELSMGIVELLQGAAADEHLADVMSRGYAGQELSPSDRYVFETRLNALLRYWEDVHYQYRMGLYDEAEFARQKLAWRASMTRGVLAINYWCSVRDLYSEEFADEMDGLLPANACAAR